MEKMLEMLLHSAMKSAGLTPEKVKAFMNDAMEKAQGWLDRQDRLENTVDRIEHNTVTIIQLVNGDLALTPSFHASCAEIGGIDLDKKIDAPVDGDDASLIAYRKGAN